jgi:hypothetical protein
MDWGDRFVRSEGHPIRYPDDDRPRHDLPDALFTVVRRWPAVWKAADHHLSATHAVRCFRQQARYLAVTDVADVLDSSISSASRAVDRAVDRGLLATAPAAMDGRGWATAGWPQRDRVAVSELLLQLVTNLRRVPPPPV